MLLDPEETHPRDFYRYMIGCITPRPIGWISTISPAGDMNLAPFSFFNGVSSQPPAVVFCPVNNRRGDKKDTLRNVEATGQFCVNIVSHHLSSRMNLTSADYEYGVSEFDQADLTPLPCERISPPRVGEAAISMECLLHTVVAMGEGPLAGHAVIGRIVLMHLDERVLDEERQIDPEKLDTIGRMGGALYCTTRDRFEMPRAEPPGPATG